MVMTDTGKNLIRDWLAGQSPTPPSHIAVGSDSTAATDDDTSLGSEIVRRAFDSTTYSDDRMVEFEMVLPTTVPSSTVHLKEMGVFNGSPTGDMFVRNTFADVEKTTDVEIQFIEGIRIS